jgi:hypothetical protein
MNQQRIYLIVLILLAVLASIPQIPVEARYWGLALVVVGLVGGVLVPFGDHTQRTVIYVVALALPVISNSLDFIPTVGPWVDGALDQLATGIQGIALGMFAVALWSRIKT